MTEKSRPRGSSPVLLESLEQMATIRQPCQGVRQRNRGDLPVHGLEPRVRLAQPLGLALELVLQGHDAPCAAQACLELAPHDRLGDVIVGAGIERLDQLPLVIAGRQHDGVSHRTRGRTAHRAAQPDAVESGHQQIGDENVGPSRAEHGEGLDAVDGGLDFESHRHQQPRQRQSLGFHVFRDQHAQTRFRRRGGDAIAHRDRIAGRCTRRRLCRRRGGLVLQREQIRYRDIAGLDVQISTPVVPRCQHVRENDLDLLAIETEPFEPRCKSFGR